MVPADQPDESALVDIVLGYIERQLKLPGSILPPVRFLYIFTGYVWHGVFRTEALASLRAVASFFSMLTLGLAALFAWRVRRSGVHGSDRVRWPLVCRCG